MLTMSFFAPDPIRKSDLAGQRLVGCKLAFIPAGTFISVRYLAMRYRHVESNPFRFVRATTRWFECGAGFSATIRPIRRWPSGSKARERKDTDARVFFAPSSLRAGGFWSRTLADEIAQADAFILLVEYDEALDKRVKLADFPIILVLLERQTAPGLPFLRHLH